MSHVSSIISGQRITPLVAPRSGIPSPTLSTRSMDAHAYPGNGLSLSQLIFALNEGLKRTGYSPSYVAKDHSSPAREVQRNDALTSSIVSPAVRFLNSPKILQTRWRLSASGRIPSFT